MKRIAVFRMQPDLTQSSMLATRPWPQGVRMAERSKRSGRRPQVSQVRSLISSANKTPMRNKAHKRNISWNQGLCLKVWSDLHQRCRILFLKLLPSYSCSYPGAISMMCWSTPCHSHRADRMLIACLYLIGFCHLRIFRCSMCTSLIINSIAL